MYERFAYLPDVTPEQALADVMRALKECFPDRWEEIWDSLPRRMHLIRDSHRPTPEPQHHSNDCPVRRGAACNCSERAKQKEAERDARRATGDTEEFRDTDFPDVSK